jgi:uncharacterized membrane protein YsdA (DUF1294 family)
LTVILTIYDKIAAKKRPKHRISEAMLILLALLGGALAEYVVMKLIRHKTRHKKFMIGLPVIIFLHILLIVLYFKYIPMPI